MSSPFSAKYKPGADGTWVHANVHHVAEILYDYDDTHSFYLAYIPPAERLPEDTHPYAVMHSLPGKAPYEVFALREDELDDRVLARLWECDMNKNDVFGKLAKSKAAKEIWEAKLKIEELEETADFMKSVLQSPKAQYRHNGKVYE